MIQAVILAAGRGSRMGELTKDIPKPLLPIGEKTIIEYILDALHVCGIFDVIIVTGYKGNSIKNKIKNQYKNCSLTYVHNDGFEASDNLYSLWLARQHIIDGMLFLNGDTLFHKDILAEVLNNFHEDCVLVDSKRTEEKNPIVIHENESRLVEIGHTISRDSHGVASGIYKLSKTTCERYFQEAGKFFTQGPRKGGFVIPLQQLASSIHFHAVYSEDERWININTLSDYERACEMIAEIST